MTASRVEILKRMTPALVSIARGASLKEKIPFLAQSRFFRKLLVDFPNIRSGLTYSIPVCLNPT
jgi:hypothetical protein